MDTFDATYLYRAEVAQAISAYRAQLRAVFERWGKPIPLNVGASVNMALAELELFRAFKRASARLILRRKGVLS